jgi:hypothetical protein
MSTFAYEIKTTTPRMPQPLCHDFFKLCGSLREISLRHSKRFRYCSKPHQWHVGQIDPRAPRIHCLPIQKVNEGPAGRKEELGNVLKRLVHQDVIEPIGRPPQPAGCGDAAWTDSTLWWYK